ncbi:hypothetical protein MRQ36_32120 [Micromonospora sp. R77]|uniref:hypothetical protein n=1 Tax=Micromonospora sp. R77 TaxID=2925836 RepID=UPI001F614C10|nr:hypothetical protein [Micromonospora sp. R77]MCI4066961.1 hypothetical protein [Micromonospora sp. R77]
MRRTVAVKMFALAAATAGLFFLGVTAAHADDLPAPDSSTTVTTVTSPTPSPTSNNPWD